MTQATLHSDVCYNCGKKILIVNNQPEMLVKSIPDPDDPKKIIEVGICYTCAGQIAAKAGNAKKAMGKVKFSQRMRLLTVSYARFKTTRGVPEKKQEGHNGGPGEPDRSN